MASLSAIVEQTYSFTETLGSTGATASGTFVVDYSYSDANAGNGNTTSVASATVVSENIVVSGGNAFLNNTFTGISVAATVNSNDPGKVSFELNAGHGAGFENALGITFTDNFINGGTSTPEYLTGQQTGQQVAFTGIQEAYQSTAVTTGFAYPTIVEQTYSFSEVLQSGGETASGNFVVDYSYASSTDASASSAWVKSENITVTGGTVTHQILDTTFTGNSVGVTLGSGDAPTMSFSMSESFSSNSNTVTDTLNITYTDNFVNGATTAEYLSGVNTGHTVGLVSTSETGNAAYTHSNIVEATYTFTEKLSDGETVAGQFVVDYSYGASANSVAAAWVKSENITVTGGSNGEGKHFDNTFSSQNNLTVNFTNITADATTMSFSLNGNNPALIDGPSSSNTWTDTLNITFSDNWVNSGSTASGAYAEYMGGTTGAHTVAISGLNEVDYKNGTYQNTFAFSLSSSTFNETGYTNGTAVGSYNSVTFTDSTGAHALNSSGATFNYYDTLGSSTAVITCYAKGTMVTTEHGEVPVEKLREGDLVLTLSGDYSPVKWLGHRRIDCKQHANPADAYPVRIVQDAFGLNMPSRDLFLSPLHSVFVDGIFVPVIDLVNDVTIFQEVRSKITYYHVELPKHDVIFAEGLTAETYLDDNNRDFFIDANTDVIPLGEPSMPKMTSAEIWTAQGFAKVHREGPEVDAIRQKLLEQAAQLVGKKAQKKSA
jgi:Hint domain